MRAWFGLIALLLLIGVGLLAYMLLEKKNNDEESSDDSTNTYILPAAFSNWGIRKFWRPQYRPRGRYYKKGRRY